jgi:1-acyl-sn-glycerol-3-phosphate acyltransferase
MNMLRGPARLILKLLGWKLLDLPQRPAKAVVIAFPHTSNRDFPMTLLALAALPYSAQWVAKDTLFRGICGPIMRGLGGVAVNRRERTGFVERLAEEFRTRKTFHLIIATEGTRGLQAGMAVVDYGKRELGLLAIITLSGDESADMARIAACYEGRKGYHHQNASPIQLL